MRLVCNPILSVCLVNAPPWQTLPYDPHEAVPMDVPSVPPGANPFADTEEVDEEH